MMRTRVARAWVVRQGRRVPLAGRVVAEATRIDLVDRCLAIGAQALLALLPLIVVLSAWVPEHVSTALIIELRNSIGLDETAAQSLQRFGTNDGSTSTQTGFIGLAFALVSATSFSRTVQRMYAKVFDLPDESLPGRLRLSAVWMVVWLANIIVLASIGRWGPGPALGWGLALLVQVAFWWWSARVMLFRARPWLDVLPVALVTTAGSSLLVAVSGRLMPRYAHVSIEQFGSFGAVTTLASWLVLYAGVLVVGAVVGRVLAEDPRWDRLTERLGRSRGPSPQ